MTTRYCDDCAMMPATHKVNKVRELVVEYDGTGLLPNLCWLCAHSRNEKQKAVNAATIQAAQERMAEKTKNETCPKCHEKVWDRTPLRPDDIQMWHRACWFGSEERQQAKKRAEADDWDVDAFLSLPIDQQMGHGLARGAPKTKTFRGQPLR